VRAVVETAARLPVSVLTLYAFSAENWKRPRSEVTTLMSLLKEYIRKELSTIHQNDIRFLTIGHCEGKRSECLRSAAHVAEIQELLPVGEFPRKSGHSISVT